jgi:hypothetical protein
MTSTLPKGRISGYNVPRGCITDMEIHCAWARTGEERNYMESKDRDKKIQVWRDPWIPRPLSWKISLKKGCSRIKWVQQLMVTGRREWDVQMLKTYMYPHDIDEVLKLCLSDRNPDDPMVKFAYKLAEQSEQEMEGST